MCHRQDAGEVVACASDEKNELFAIVTLFEWEVRVTANSYRCYRTPYSRVWRASALVSPSAWYPHGDAFVIIF